MRIEVDVPDDVFASMIRQGLDPETRTRESLGIEGVRTGTMTEHQVCRLPGLESIFALHAFMAERGVTQHYTEPDLEADLAAADADAKL